MYRVKVEKVGGTYALAGGKWLRCIGNKNVNVGDYVFTDGRCVYGYDKESMTPFVPTPDGEFIPLVVYTKNSKLSSSSYYNLKTKGAYKLMNNNDNLFNDTTYFLNSKKSTYVFGNTYVNFSDTGSIYTATQAANIDKEGNIYEIRKQRINAGLVPTGFKVQIIKNNVIMRDFDFTDYLEQLNQSTVADASSRIMHIFNGCGTPYTYMHVGFAVIENENDWAFIVSLTNHVEASGYIWYDGNPPPTPHNPDFRVKNVCDVALSQCWLYTPDDKYCFYDAYRIFHEEYRGHAPLGDATYNPAGIITDSLVEHTTPFDNSKIPIQDGYYWKLNSLSPRNGYLDPMYNDSGVYITKYYIYTDDPFPKIANISIYSPNDKILVRGEITLGTDFSIYKGHLLGVNAHGGYGLLDRNFYNYTYIGKKLSSEIDSGLYIISNNNIEQILSGEAKNQKLHSMVRKRLNWYSSIQEL